MPIYTKIFEQIRFIEMTRDTILDAFGYKYLSFKIS